MMNLFDTVDRYGKFVASEKDGPRAALGKVVVEWDWFRDVSLEKIPEIADHEKAVEQIRKEFARAKDVLIKWGVIGVSKPYLWWSGKPVRGFPRTFPTGQEADQSRTGAATAYFAGHGRPHRWTGDPAVNVRVDVVALGDEYCAIFRRPGRPDEFLVDDRGRPQKFASASVAIRQGRKSLVVADAPAVAPTDDDVLGIRSWRADKDAELAAERERVFGQDKPKSIERGGRTVIIECRRLR